MKIKTVKHFFILVIVIMIMALNACSYSSEKKHLTLEKKLQISLDTIQKTVKFPGATLAIIMPDNTMINLATGYSDKEDKIKMEKDYRMFVGSTGKTFVAAVLMKLVEEGRLSLNDPLSKYFKDTDWYSRIPNADSITLYHLAHHTSGIPRYILNPEFGKDILENPNKFWTPSELLEYLEGQEPIHTPGEGWGYSDTNYILLGMVIEQVTGNPFYQEVADRFLKPYHLDDIEPSTSRTPERFAQGYSGKSPFVHGPDKVMKNGVYFINPQFEWCGGGFLSSVTDLAKWSDLYYKGKLLTENSMNQITTCVDFKTGKLSDEGYGIASMTTQTAHGTKIGHTGQMPGYITEIGYYEDHDILLVMQINQDNWQGNPKVLADYSSILAGVVIDHLKERSFNK